MASPFAVFFSTLLARIDHRLEGRVERKGPKVQGFSRLDRDEKDWGLSDRLYAKAERATERDHRAEPTDN